MEEMAGGPGTGASDDPDPHGLSRWLRLSLLIAAFLAVTPRVLPAQDTLAKVRTSGQLTYGADEEGGAPYLYLDPDTQKRVGFEPEIMAELGRAIGFEPKFLQCQWEYLPQVLARGEIDVVMNGFELTEARAKEYLPSRPYYLFQLQLMVKKGAAIHSLADVVRDRPGGGPWKIGVLGMSAADTHLQRLEREGLNVRPVSFDGATAAMLAVKNGQIDGTLQDLPAALHYIKKQEFADLELAGPPDGQGYYVLYVRKGDLALKEALDKGIGELIASGKLKAILEKYGIWTEAQTVLANWSDTHTTASASQSSKIDLGLIVKFLPYLLWGAGTTIVLAFASMPLAIVMGLTLALGRLYGPKPLAAAFTAWVELIRGTPLILQLFVLFYLLPELGLTLSPWAAGIAGLAINYSAYEAEIYRAGLQAIPKGQMEAALALGMTRGMALRRVIVPQAVRIVIPPVTSDFIALFKDTSVCSVITLTELTKRYSVLFNGYGGVVEFGLATAALYMAMSLPLSWFSRWVERVLDAEQKPGGGA